jgi:hypothetical protein
MKYIFCYKSDSPGRFALANKPIQVEIHSFECRIQKVDLQKQIVFSQSVQRLLLCQKWSSDLTK